MWYVWKRLHSFMEQTGQLKRGHEDASYGFSILSSLFTNGCPNESNIVPFQTVFRFSSKTSKRTAIKGFGTNTKF